MKKLIAFLCGVCLGIGLMLAYLHRGMILATLKGEPMPEAPEGCPAFRKEPEAEAPETPEPESEPEEA